MIAGRSPSFSSRRAIYCTTGVFPVPPRVRLPTLMTGTSTRLTRSIPALYSDSRKRITAQYRGESGLPTAKRRVRSITEIFRSLPHRHDAA
jgi:hypothetical protein